MLERCQSAHVERMVRVIYFHLPSLPTYYSDLFFLVRIGRPQSPISVPTSTCLQLLTPQYSRARVADNPLHVLGNPNSLRPKCEPRSETHHLTPANFSLSRKTYYGLDSQKPYLQNVVRLFCMDYTILCRRVHQEA